MIKKHVIKWLFGAMVITLPATFAACEKDNNAVSGAGVDDQYKAILNEYVESTVAPTYKSLAEAALEMRTANAALKNGQSQAAIEAAAGAWMKARVFWEKSEAFLFGPVGPDGFDIDGHIDSWPLEKSEIDQVLATDAAGLTGEIAWGTLDAEVIGFHVTEYLLFRDGKARASLTDAELKYLTAATDALVWDCVLAYVAWVGEENVSAEIGSVFRENPEVVAALSNKSSFKNFASMLKNATGNYEGHLPAAVSEISNGAADIAGEVGETKIAEPFASGAVENVESWYSWHSLDDYGNNIISIKNAYYGGIDRITPHSNSLSAFVASKNAKLDEDIKNKIEDCLTKIAAIGNGGKSFYEVVRDHSNEAEVDAAVDACAELEALLASVETGIIL
ncbi:MAG: hypothetical protein LBT48_07870 [Prevotellaceae bacterium]|jgi:uncharacterized iron-regulated protein|nr:hypothetical protein [Prevotellaceae bacterium]